RKRLPAKLAYGLTRAKNVLLQQYFYRAARKHPEQAKERLISMVRDELGQDYDVGTHFTPRYNPWDQRLCLVPDADLFASIRDGSSSVVTGTIDSFTETGIRLESGEELAADIVVAATGLELQLLGNVPVEVDGKLVEPSKAMTYKGMMLS